MCKTPIDAYAIALNETDHYAIEEADRPYIEKITGVYLLDRNQRTHCCELTPSYWLIHLYDQVVLTDAGQELDDYAVDALYQKYENCGGENIYVHCHSIDALIERNEKWSVYHYGDPEIDEDDVDYDDQIEGIREHLCGNCPF